VPYSLDIGGHTTEYVSHGLCDATPTAQCKEIQWFNCRPLPTCTYSMPSLLAGVGQLSQLAKLWPTVTFPARALHYPVTALHLHLPLYSNYTSTVCSHCY